LRHRIPLTIALDRNSPVALHRQLYEALRGAIAKGGVAAGSLLPSTRWLARHLAVSRNTVLNAYETLASEGLVDGKIGSGTAVRSGVRPPRLPDPRIILRRSHYPVNPVPFPDPDGNPLYLHRAILIERRP
jgi:GntR family transcriptional regulator/MocR family aminotransferase